MDALKKNKFLATYVAILAVGLLVFGWLFYSSLGAHSAAKTSFEEEKEALSRLKSKALFPNETNLKARLAQVEEFTTSVDGLQQSLMAAQPPLATGTSSASFQTKLTQVESDLKAQAEYTKLGSGSSSGNFSLGFDENPPESAVPDLDFQLDALSTLVRTLITDRVSSIDAITRAKLDVENRAAEAPAAASSRQAAQKPAGPTVALAENEVFKRYPFTLRFTGSPRSIQDALNHLASSKDYFYAIRSLRLENEKKDGPDRGQVASSSDQNKKDSSVVLGGEKVTVWLSVDLIRFLDPKVAAAEVKKQAAQAN